jgi:hypothetical protein
MKMHSVGAEFHADRWTDIITLRVAFYNFVNMPTKQSISWNHVSHHLKVTLLSLLKKKVTALNLLQLHYRDLSFFSVTKGQSY